MGKIIFVDDYAGQVMKSELSNGWIIAIALIALVVIVGLYLLRSFGLYKLAKNNGVDKAFIAWIPCVWVYTACKLVKEYKFFSYSYQKFAVWFAVIFSVAQVLTLTYTFLLYFPLVGYFLQGGNIYLGEYAKLVNANAEEFIFIGNLFVDHIVYPYTNFKALSIVLDIMSTASGLFDLAVAIIQINLYLVLFRKFWPEHYIVGAIVSFFGLFPFFIFAIRNKRAVRVYRYTPNYTNYNQRPQGYSQPQRPVRRDEDPFIEFSDKDDDPFSDIFNNDKKNGDN
jgi:hypothetical protein